ncbi:hypothetical protein OAC19_00675 [Candidatus Pelagibacter sp.]|nr:hypothetical protein [Candidatus Pelagibacter sp.]
MISKTKKPYVIYMAEIIYSYVSIIKKKYSNIETKEAINKFMETEEFNKLSNGTLHDEWFAQLKKNNYLDQETGNKIPDETIKLLGIQKDMTIKQLIKVPALYDSKNNTLIDVSMRAHQFLWRMCESYELWCKETKQPELLPLNITD